MRYGAIYLFSGQIYFIGNKVMRITTIFCLNRENVDVTKVKKNHFGILGIYEKNMTKAKVNIYCDLTFDHIPGKNRDQMCLNLTKFRS